MIVERDGWVEFPLRIYYEDTDAQGVVYFANYQRFMERGRTEWLRVRKVEQDVLRREHNVIFSLISAAVKYHKPAQLDNEIIVRTRVSQAKGVRVCFEQEVRLNTADGELLASAENVAASLNAESLRPTRLPAEVQAMLSADA